MPRTQEVTIVQQIASQNTSRNLHKHISKIFTTSAHQYLSDDYIAVFTVSHKSETIRSVRGYEKKFIELSSSL